jgi:hypothetical protein
MDTEALSFVRVPLSITSSLGILSIAGWYEVILEFSIVLILLSATIFFVAAFYFYTFRTKQNPTVSISYLGFWTLLPLGVLAFIGKATKYGEWDAWMTWNLHAKYLNGLGGWPNELVEAVPHSDYPMFLSSLVALGFRYLGESNFAVPFLIAVLVLFLIYFTWFNVFQKAKYGWVAFLGIILFIFDSEFTYRLCSQYPDSFLALTILLTTILIHRSPKKPVDFISIGFISALAGWIKNEGLVFYSVTFIVIIILLWKNLSMIKWFLIGSLIPILVIVHFKLNYAPANDLVNLETGRDFSNFINPKVYLQIIKFWAQLILTSFPILLVVTFFFLKLKPHKSIYVPLILFLGLTIGYFLAYLLSPYNLEWHLRTSMSRLIHHAYPSLLYLFLFSIATKTSPKEWKVMKKIKWLQPKEKPTV